MIGHLRGTVHRLHPGEVTVEVQGVGYRVFVPLDIWETFSGTTPELVWISTYVREDRLELFGFKTAYMRALFESLIGLSGIGPKTALEICAVPRNLLKQAIEENDHSMLTSIKGIGKKTAEKLLPDLRSLAEKHPQAFELEGAVSTTSYDADAAAALSSLGYDTSTIAKVLRGLPAELTTTEERVTAALRSL